MNRTHLPPLSPSIRRSYHRTAPYRSYTRSSPYRKSQDTHIIEYKWIIVEGEELIAYHPTQCSPEAVMVWYETQILSGKLHSIVENNREYATALLGFTADPRLQWIIKDIDNEAIEKRQMEITAKALEERASALDAVRKQDAAYCPRPETPFTRAFQFTSGKKVDVYAYMTRNNVVFQGNRISKGHIDEDKW